MGCKGRISLKNVALSWFCAPARLGHNMHAISVGFALPCIASFWCMPCMLFYWQNEVRRILGASNMGILTNCCCSCCCSCYVLAQHAEALDAASRHQALPHSSPVTEASYGTLVGAPVACD